MEGLEHNAQVAVFQMMVERLSTLERLQAVSSCAASTRRWVLAAKPPLSMPAARCPTTSSTVFWLEQRCR
jgi:hypothetical protein